MKSITEKPFRRRTGNFCLLCRYFCKPIENDLPARSSKLNTRWVAERIAAVKVAAFGETLHGVAIPKSEQSKPARSNPRILLMSGNLPTRLPTCDRPVMPARAASRSTKSIRDRGLSNVLVLIVGLAVYAVADVVCRLVFRVYAASSRSTKRRVGKSTERPM